MSLELEALAERIARQTGMPIDRARLVARQNLPAAVTLGAPAPDVQPSVLAAQDGRAEKAQQDDIRKLWITLGGKVWNTSAVTRAKITPGIADLYLTLPRWHFAMWWESKSAEAVRRVNHGRSPEQMDFAAHTEAAGVAYGVGTFRDFVHWLLAHPATNDLGRTAEVFEALTKNGLQAHMIDPQATSSGVLYSPEPSPHAPQ